jgi:hypothetical protein
MYGGISTSVIVRRDFNTTSVNARRDFSLCIGCLEGFQPRKMYGGISTTVIVYRYFNLYKCMEGFKPPY